MRSRRKVINRFGLPPSKYLTVAEEQKIRAYCRQAREAATRTGTTRAWHNECIILLGLTAGLRASEICDLRIKDTPAGHDVNVVWVEAGKGGVCGAVQIPADFAEYLREYVRRCRPWAKPESPVIPSERGYRTISVHRVIRTNGRPQKVRRRERTARLSRQCLYRKVRQIGRAAGVPRLHPHMLRHTYGVRLYSIANDLSFTADQMRHANIETTRIYAATTPRAAEHQIKHLQKFAAWREELSIYA